jgi:hypothetical protein
MYINNNNNCGDSTTNFVPTAQSIGYIAQKMNNNDDKLNNNLQTNDDGVPLSILLSGKDLLDIWNTAYSMAKSFMQDNPD